jgi:hypothetical protein
MDEDYEVENDEEVNEEDYDKEVTEEIMNEIHDADSVHNAEEMIKPCSCGISMTQEDLLDSPGFCTNCYTFYRYRHKLSVFRMLNYILILLDYYVLYTICVGTDNQVNNIHDVYRICRMFLVLIDLAIDPEKVYINYIPLRNLPFYRLIDNFVNCFVTAFFLGLIIKNFNNAVLQKFIYIFNKLYSNQLLYNLWSCFKIMLSNVSSCLFIYGLGYSLVYLLENQIPDRAANIISIQVRQTTLINILVYTFVFGIIYT